MITFSPKICFYILGQNLSFLVQNVSWTLHFRKLFLLFKIVKDV